LAGLDQAFQHIDRFAEQWIKAANIPGLAIAVTDREKTLHVSTFGLADPAAKTPVGPDTLFEIGSLSKPFTSIPILQLREEGKLDLNKPVADYLPWFRVQSAHPASLDEPHRWDRSGHRPGAPRFV
jgi:CubicO group peptidase (beta-lactamase class C family)